MVLLVVLVVLGLASVSGEIALDGITTGTVVRDPRQPELLPEAARQLTGVFCNGQPSKSPYVRWNCPDGTSDGSRCAGLCVERAQAPYGAPVAVCTAGNYTILTRCMAGGVYGFDEERDGEMPSPAFLNLVWRGLRVATADFRQECAGDNGIKHGLVSGSNVAISEPVGAKADLSNLVRISPPTGIKGAKLSVLGFTATAAYQDRLRIDIAAWDADDQRLGHVAYTISFKNSTYIDLRRDMRFSGIHKLSIISSGGKPGTTCQNGKQVVIDDLEIYLQRD